MTILLATTAVVNVVVYIFAILKVAGRYTRATAIQVLFFLVQKRILLTNPRKNTASFYIFIGTLIIIALVYTAGFL